MSWGYSAFGCSSDLLVVSPLTSFSAWETQVEWLLKYLHYRIREQRKLPTIHQWCPNTSCIWGHDSWYDEPARSHLHMDYCQRWVQLSCLDEETYSWTELWPSLGRLFAYFHHLSLVLRLPWFIVFMDSWPRAHMCYPFMVIHKLSGTWHSGLMRLCPLRRMSCWGSSWG